MNKINSVFLLLLMMMTCKGALDENRVPTTNIGFFASLSDYCTLKWYRESTMLSAFEKNINDPHDQEALETFKKKFRPEYCRKHPELIEKAIKHKRPDLLKFMEERLNVQDTAKYCKDPEMQYPLHWLAQDDDDKSVETIAVMVTVLKFDPAQKDDKNNTVLHVAVQNKALQVQKKLIALSGSDTPLHIVAHLQPPSAHEALFEELLKNNFDAESRDAQGKTVSEINNEQEECYCNPLNNRAFPSEEEIDARQRECEVVRDVRKPKYSKRLATIFIETDHNLTDEQNAEISKKTREERELEKQQMAEEEKQAKEEEKIAQEALLRKKLHDENKKLHDENDAALVLKAEQIIEANNIEHEKRKQKILNFYNDNN